MVQRLRVSNIGKSYAVPVLQGVDLDISAGEIHGLVGENGAGKSTLINILCGLVTKDTGEIELDGQKYTAKSSLQAMHLGVSLASQEMSLIDELSIAENISLRNLPSKLSFIERDRVRQKAQQLLKDFGLSQLNIDKKLSVLSLAQKQLVELCKALSEPCKLLILDEPTAALSQEQSDLLHAKLNQLAQSGVSILYVSHRLEDIVQMCHRVSVLRDGKMLETYTQSNYKSDDLIASMSGGLISFSNHNNTNSTPESSSHDNEYAKTGGKQLLLEVKEMRTAALPNPIDLKVYSHEIVGIAGLAGAGRTEVLEGIFGIEERISGEVLRYKTDVMPIRDSSHAVSLGVGMLSEDRKQSGIFSQQSLLFNTSISDLTRGNKGKLSQHIVSFTRQKTLCDSLFQRLQVKHDSLLQHIDELSGGNQQKVLLGRWLYANTEVFLLDEPTRGVDIGAKSVIYQHLSSLKKQGAACVVVSSEIEELFTLCDRIVVMSNKSIVGELDKSSFTKRHFLQLAFSNLSNTKEAVLR